MIQMRPWQYTPSGSWTTKLNLKSTASECIIVTNLEERKVCVSASINII